MEHAYLLCMFIAVCFSLCSSAPAAVHQPSKEVAEPVFTGKTRGPKNEDENVEALRSLATAANETTIPEAAVNKSEVAAEAKNHRNLVTHRIHENKRSLSNTLSELSASKDTPRDMAEYIFWTGDENGVTKAISEFVEQDLMSQDEGLAFLEEVKYFLELLQQKYGTVSAVAGLGVEADQQAQHPAEQIHPDFASSKVSNAKANGSKQVQEERIRSNTETKIDSVTDMKDGLELAELLSNEYSLEEIIYQLSRILFTQSLSQEGNVEAEDALQRFADFLEKDSKEGRLSPQLQKKVLDVLLMALFDALAEQTHNSANSKKINLELLKKPKMSAKTP